MLLMTLALLQAVPAESLAAPMPAGFKVGFQAAQGPQSIEERVPVAETVEDWSRMITVQRFGGGAPFGAHAFADRLGAMMMGGCPGAVVAPVVDGKDGDTVVATMRVDCPLNPATGKPETMIGRVFQGPADLHMVQYAVRAKPNAANVAAATAYIGSVHLR